MKICMLIDSWKPIWGGGQAHVWELGKRLVQNHGCLVDLLVMNIKGNNDKKVEKYFNNKLRIFKIGKVSNFNFISRLGWCCGVIKAIKKINKKRNYDVIHAHANLAGLPAKIAGRMIGVPVIYTVHGCGLEAIKDMYGSGLRSYFLYKVENFLQTKIKYDCEITVDRSFLKYRNRNKNIKVIPNGVDIEKFDRVKIKKSKKFKIIFVGRLHPQKGLTYLLDALDLVKDKLKNVEVHIIGDGELKEELKAKSKKLGLDGVVKFRGKIYGDELIKEYKSSHLFVLPSLYEGQPLTLLEAWAAKLPVIVTDVGGNRDFVVEGENGHILPPKDINKLAKTLLNTINDKSFKKLGGGGYRMIKEKNDWRYVTKNTSEVYCSITSKLNR